MDSKKLKEAIKKILEGNYSATPISDLLTAEIMFLLSENCWLKTEDPCINCPDKKEDAYGLLCILTCSKDLTMRKPICPDASERVEVEK